MTKVHPVDIERGIPLGADSGGIVNRLDELLRRRKVTPNPACRYSMYRKILLARAQGIPPRGPTQEHLYATAELFQFEWIVSCHMDDDPQWPIIKRALFQDPAVPKDARVHSPGRDAQFELYVAARLKVAGLTPSFAEPDIRATLSGWPFCVAAKRVKSRKALLQEIKSARDQIKKSGMDGIIALDYSFVAASENVTYLNGDLGAGHAWAQGFSAREFHTPWPAVLNAVSRTPETFGVLIFARLFHLHPDLRTHIISELHFSRPLCDLGDFRAKKLAAIQERLRASVLPSDTCDQ